MAENLKTSIYSNGDPIANVTNGAVWMGLTTGAWGYFENNSGYNCPYGKLYNWYAVVDSRKVCPVGWHVPSYPEWTTLSNYGLYSGAMQSTGTQYWVNQFASGTNASGFSGLAGGIRNEGGYYDELKFRGSFWSTTEANSINGYYGNMPSDGSTTFYRFKQSGLSVRCLYDLPVGISPGFPEPSGREAMGAELRELVTLNPNPANTEVSLEISSAESGECRIEITDMLGKVLLEENRSLQPGANVLSYDIRNFRNGIYQVRVLRGSSHKVYRLVKN